MEGGMFMRGMVMPIHRDTEVVWISDVLGRSIKAKTKIPQKTIVIEDRGVCLSHESFLELPIEMRELAFGFDEQHVIAPYDPRDPDFHNLPIETILEKIDPCFFSNHSCKANLQRKDFFRWETVRDIERGEDLTADYALLWPSSALYWAFDAPEGWSFVCKCGEEECRGLITSWGWMLPRFRGSEYDGQFPPHIDDARRALWHREWPT